MDNSVNNCERQRVFSNHQIKTINQEEDQEESSWLIYFEDIDNDDEMVETKEGMSHYYDNDSSMISDAASPVHNTKISRKANNINTNPKKRRILHQHKEKEEEKQKGEDEEEEDEEDTASSPSNKAKGFSVLDGAKDNAIYGKSMDNITSEEKGCITDTGSKIGEVMNEEFFSAELKKRGLCVVPLSMLSNFIA